MNLETTERLNRLNCNFYGRSAAEFSRTRGNPWSGWERIVERATRRRAPSPFSILDVGCGNGRFARFADDKVGPIDYLGIDVSEELLEIARGELAALSESAIELTRTDLVDDSVQDVLMDRVFDLIAVFGVMHHVPGFETRRDLLSTLRAHLRPGGLLAVGFWQFGGSDRFQRRTVDWDDYNRTADEPIETSQLEPGDYLLAWGEGRDALRYCHYADPDEVTRLLEAAGIGDAETYFADGHGGRLNLYALIGK